MTLDQNLIIDLSSRTKLQFRGPDCVRYLNGQVTNDVRKLNTTPEAAIMACVLTIKGKMCADIFISTHAESIFVDADCGLRENLLARFERYIIADDVQLEDQTESTGLLHLVGPITEQFIEIQTLIEDLKIKNPQQIFFAVRTMRFRQPGIDLFFPCSLFAEITALLSQQCNLHLLSKHDAECFRIQQGIPRWGKELDENTIPVEAGLEEQAIDYAKGCYMGQEVISRIKSLGHVNRHLRSLKIIEQTQSFEEGFKLQAAQSDSEEKKAVEVGKITSIAKDKNSSSETCILGYVNRRFDRAQERLKVVSSVTNETVGEVEVCHL